ncbi:MAG TPA: hypothetical protein V6D26_01630 [Stenomitos sp.]
MPTKKKQAEAIEVVPTFKRLGRIEGQALQELQDWCLSIKGLMKPSVSGYAQGRLEMPIRTVVGLGKNPKPAVPVSKKIAAVTDRIEVLGDRLLPGFHQGLLLWYPAGTQIKAHRDAPAYATFGKAQGKAASVNAIGNATFFISESQDANKVTRYPLAEGDCIQFDNKQPHGIETVTEDRWVICFFYLKDEYLPTIFSLPVHNSIDFENVGSSEPDPEESEEREEETEEKPPIETASSVNHYYSIDWEPKPQLKVAIPLDGKIGTIQKVTSDRSISGLWELQVHCTDGSVEHLYAHQCQPLQEVAV